MQSKGPNRLWLFKSRHLWGYRKTKAPNSKLVAPNAPPPPGLWRIFSGGVVVFVKF